MRGARGRSFILEVDSMEKASFQDLIARKMQKEQDKHKFIEINVSSMGKSLVFKKPSDDAVMDTMDEIRNGQTTGNAFRAYKKLIYLACDTLQDPQLHEELQIKDPFDTAGEIFDFVEIMEIGDKLMDFVGITNMGDEIKNS